MSGKLTLAKTYTLHWDTWFEPIEIALEHTCRYMPSNFRTHDVTWKHKTSSRKTFAVNIKAWYGYMVLSNEWYGYMVLSNEWYGYMVLSNEWYGIIKRMIWILRGYHMGGSVIWFLSNEWWCDITNERGTSEWVISHQHEFDKIISQWVIFLSYTTTPGLIENFVHTYHSHIYYTSTYCHFLTLQIAVCLSCQTQQAIHNVLCDVLWQQNKKIYIKKN